MAEAVIQIRVNRVIRGQSYTNSRLGGTAVFGMFNRK